jgi:hypothetical protein
VLVPGEWASEGVAEQQITYCEPVPETPDRIHGSTSRTGLSTVSPPGTLKSGTTQLTSVFIERMS